ncbi:MAG TPA: SCO family protein [Polyangia bacterium]|nr:SCO family protein [Polyangia bacterium]
MSVVVERRVGLWVALSVGFVLVAGGLLGRRLDPTRRLAAARIKRPTPFALPEFHLVDQEGRAIDKAQLAGHVVVADFVFLQCGDTCARLTRRFRALQRQTAAQAWGSALRFVSFSVDSDDTPPTLARYRRDYGPPDGRWRLVAADERDFPRLAVGMGLADVTSDVPNAFVASSRYMFVIDREGIVRNRYDGFSDDDAERLARDVAALAQDGSAP